MFVVFSRVLAIFMLILIGFIANKVGVLTDEAKKPLTNLMLCITAPCMAASSIYSKELSDDVITSTIQVLIGATIYFVVVSFFAYFVIRILKFKPREEWGMYIVAIACINSGFMGFPVTKAIFGDDLFYLMVMHNIILCIYLYTISPAVMFIGRENKHSKNGNMLKSMINPCTVGIIVGVVFLLIGYQPPDEINDVVLSLSDATIPLSMIIVGIQLGSSNIKDMIKNKYVNITNIVAMVIVPILTFLVVNPMDFLRTDVKVILIFASVFPTAVVPAAIAEKEGMDATRLAEIISVTTVTSLVVIPITAALLMGYYY